MEATRANTSLPFPDFSFLFFIKYFPVIQRVKSVAGRSGDEVTVRFLVCVPVRAGSPSLRQDTSPCKSLRVNGIARGSIFSFELLIRDL